MPVSHSLKISLLFYPVPKVESFTFSASQILTVRRERIKQYYINIAVKTRGEFKGHLTMQIEQLDEEQPHAKRRTTIFLTHRNWGPSHEYFGQTSDVYRDKNSYNHHPYKILSLRSDIRYKLVLVQSEPGRGEEDGELVETVILPLHRFIM